MSQQFPLPSPSLPEGDERQLSADQPTDSPVPAVDKAPATINHMQTAGLLTPPLAIVEKTNGVLFEPQPEQDQERDQHQQQHQQQQQQHGTAADINHDIASCMFRMALDSKGTTAALCYLPTRFQGIVEFYHTEIPPAYRDMGVGEALLNQAFVWAEKAHMLVIPTCPFTRRYVDRNAEPWLLACVVQNEYEGVTRLLARQQQSNDKA